MRQSGYGNFYFWKSRFHKNSTICNDFGETPERAVTVPTAIFRDNQPLVPFMREKSLRFYTMRFDERAMTLTPGPHKLWHTLFAVRGTCYSMDPE